MTRDAMIDTGGERNRVLLENAVSWKINEGGRQSEANLSSTLIRVLSSGREREREKERAEREPYTL
jgi:hypothetical protein